MLGLHILLAVGLAAFADALSPLGVVAAFLVIYVALRLAIDLDEQARLVRDFGTQPVLLLRNHGVLTVGRTAGEAFMLLYYFERAARIQRQGVIEALVRQGVPVAAWTGPTSLAGLLLAMEQAQHAPRVVVR